MKQEDKELLLRDLCSRLPYGIKIHAKDIDINTNVEVEKVGELSMVDGNGVIAFTCDDTNYYHFVDIHEVKPYLFPLSSMTEEQDKEFSLLQTSAGQEGFLYIWNCANMMKWLIENHFDYNGLILKGLAIDATSKNIY